MDTLPTPPRHTGSVLAHDLDSLTVAPTFLIDDLLYDNAAMMIASDPGMGKSTLALQIAMCLTTATPVFGTLTISRPRTVYYLQLERSYRETVARIRDLRQAIPLNPDLLWVDTDFHPNLTKPGHLALLQDRIAAWRRPDLIIIDPIYMAVRGGISKDEPSSALVQASNALMHRFTCSNLLLHHNHRERYSTDGSKLSEDDRFYGSIWLKAHVSLSYSLEHTTKRRDRPTLTLKKDSENCARYKRLEMVYHPETHMCELFTNSELGQSYKRPALERLLTFLRQCYTNKKQTDLYECHEVAHVSVAQIKRLLNEPPINKVVELHKSPGSKTLWEVKKEIEQVK